MKKIGLFAALGLIIGTLVAACMSGPSSTSRDAASVRGATSQGVVPPEGGFAPTGNTPSPMLRQPQYEDLKLLMNNTNESHVDFNNDGFTDPQNYAGFVGSFETPASPAEVDALVGDPTRNIAGLPEGAIRGNDVTRHRLPLSPSGRTEPAKPGESLKHGQYPARPRPERAAVTQQELSATEELWIIQRYTAAAPQPADDTPGCGALITCPPGQTREVPVPLNHTDVQASVAGYIASVEVTQKFHNPFTSKIEAVYVFPLPENAGVNEFLMTVGDRKIRGIVRDREVAQQIYTQARAAGYVASLLTQQRPNVFTQKVANIEPGKSIDVTIKYFNTLAYYDGWYQFVFPMVVGPRFNPPGSTSGIGSVARGDQGASGQRTEVQYLNPGERSGHDISISLNIDAGVEIEEVRCRSHAVETDRPRSSRAKVRLSSSDTIPNRDFVLAWRVAGDKVKSTLLTHRDSRGGYFTLMLVPPATLDTLDRSPMEMVFVVDRSGSMDGHPIQQARDAAERGLKKLQSGDTFQIIDFANDTSEFGAYPVDANRSNLARAQEYVQQLDAKGGTMMMRGLKAALDFPHDPQRLRVVAFLTDGYIGNEGEILGELHRGLGSTRVFSFGVGTSVNRFLLDSMAKMGRGAAAYLAAGDPAAEPMDLFFERVSHPAMTDLSIDWGDARVSEVYPTQLPDLFVGRPVIITGRFEGDFDGKVRVHGRAGGHEIQVGVTRDDTGTPAALPTVWARMKIADLSDRATWEPNGYLGAQVRQVALDYGLLSQFTSFVAVDSMTRTAGDFGTTVGVPVPVPDGVRYDTTVVEQPQAVSTRR